MKSTGFEVDRLDITPEIEQQFYSYEDAMALLGYEDEHAFWLAYKSGKILPAVWLPTDERGLMFACWERKTFCEWVAAGAKPMPGVAEHHEKVFEFLRKNFVKQHPLFEAMLDEEEAEETA